MINVEDLRYFCLSLGDDVDERFPFVAFKSAQNILVFYVAGHMFCYYDLDVFDVVTVKCQPDRIVSLREMYDYIVKPYNASSRHWIGIAVGQADDSVVMDLVRNSYEIVKGKYQKKH